MLKAILSNEDDNNLIKRSKLATSMVMLAQGVPFIHAGQESLATKGGIENSFNSSVEVNEIHWDRVFQHTEMVDYFRKLVKLRKEHAVFRQNDYSEIAKTVQVISAGEDGIFVFEYHADDENIGVLFNVSDQKVKFDRLDLSKAKKLLDSAGDVQLSENVELMPLSTLVVENKV